MYKIINYSYASIYFADHTHCTCMFTSLHPQGYGPHPLCCALRNGERCSGVHGWSKPVPQAVGAHVQKGSPEIAGGGCGHVLPSPLTNPTPLPLPLILTSSNDMSISRRRTIFYNACRSTGFQTSTNTMMITMAIRC